MKHVKNNALRTLVRVLVIAVAIALLLLPGLSMIAVAWADIDLVVALVAITVCILIAIWLPRLRWIGAAIASLLVAVPPYPYWLNWNDARGWHLHFFHGVKLESSSIAVFAMIFLAAMLLFAAIFWAIGNRQAAQS